MSCASLPNRINLIVQVPTHKGYVGIMANIDFLIKRRLALMKWHFHAKAVSFSTQVCASYRHRRVDEERGIDHTVDDTADVTAVMPDQSPPADSRRAVLRTMSGTCFFSCFAGSFVLVDSD